MNKNPKCPKCKKPTLFLDAITATKNNQVLTVKIYKCYKDNILVSSELKT